MRTDIPESQKFDAFELESQGIREFYKIEFLAPDDPVMYITPHNETVWMDQTWESLQCNMSENAQNSSGEMSRPKFTIVNPNGMFSLWIEAGYTDGAILSRYRVMLSDLEIGAAVYTKQIWTLSKVVSLNKKLAVFECRSTIDGPNFDLPARSFYPPDFPHVSLQ